LCLELWFSWISKILSKLWWQYIMVIKWQPIFGIMLDISELWRFIVIFQNNSCKMTLDCRDSLILLTLIPNIQSDKLNAALTIIYIFIFKKLNFFNYPFTKRMKMNYFWWILKHREVQSQEGKALIQDQQSYNLKQILQ
jgi:hypothetical protein